MADDLALVLALLHDSGKRWRTLRAEGEEWIDSERSKEAFLRSVRPGSIVTARGAPGPDDRDPRWKLWASQPDLSRVDFGIGHGQRILVISDGSRMCSSVPYGGYRVSDRGEHDSSLGAAAPLVRPFALPGIVDLGRRACPRARPSGRDRRGPAPA